MLSVQPLNADNSLIRDIGPWALTAFAINMTVGAGIFGLPARIQALVGNHIVVVVIICGLLIALIALCFAEIGSRFDRSGGSATLRFDRIRTGRGVDRKDHRLRNHIRDAAPFQAERECAESIVQASSRRSCGICERNPVCAFPCQQLDARTAPSRACCGGRRGSVWCHTVHTPSAGDSHHLS
jgi:hypothetical protein